MSTFPRPLAALLGALAVTTLAGCATAGAPRDAVAPSDPPAATSASTAPATSPSTAASAGVPTCPALVGSPTLGVADGGHSVCVPVGARVTVMLRGTPVSRWTPVEVTGTALTHAANGRGTLQLGVTGGFFVAARAGTAQITSQRPACPAAPAGAARCTAITTWAVTVRVGG